MIDITQLVPYSVFDTFRGAKILKDSWGGPHLTILARSELQRLVRKAEEASVYDLDPAEVAWLTMLLAESANVALRDRLSHAFPTVAL